MVCHARGQVEQLCENSFQGLTVELFLDQENYMLKKLSKKAGIRMVLHDPYLPPLPEDNGLDLMPNTASSISIQRVGTQSKIQYVIYTCTIRALACFALLDGDLQTDGTVCL